MLYPSGTLSRISFWAAGSFLVILTGLHFIKPEIDPSWNFISEYQTGRLGWLMSVTFFALSMSCLFLIASLWKYLRSAVGIIGLFLLFLSATGMLIAAFNPPDPINTRPEQVTAQGDLHQTGAMLDQIPFAAILISIALIRNHSYWKENKKILIGSTLLVWMGLIVFIVSMAMYMPTDRIFGPHTPFGWPNRLMISVQAIWLMIVARLAYKNSASVRIEKSMIHSH
jgi:hypothetical protein